MTKSLIIGDLHIKRDNTNMVNLFRNELLNHLKSNEYDFVCILGDVLHYHEKVYIQCMNMAIDLFRAIVEITHKPLYVLVGNHDLINNTTYCDPDSHWMTTINIPNICIVWKPTLVGTHLFVPYIEAGEFLQVIKSHNIDMNLITTMYAHQEFIGCKMGAFPSKHGDPIDWIQSHQLVVSGHIHEKQWMEQKVYYVGSAFQHGFGDDTKKSIAVIDNNVVEDIILNLPYRYTIHMKPKDVTKSWVLGLVHTHYYRILITCSLTDWNQFKKTSVYKLLLTRDQIIVKHVITLMGETHKKPTNEISTVSFQQECIKRLDGNTNLLALFQELL